MRTRHYRLFLLVLAVLPVALPAAETLEAAWQAALDHNYRLKAAQADTQASAQQLEAAQGQRWPVLTVGGGYTQYSESIAANTALVNPAPATGSGSVNSGGNFQFYTAQQGSAKAQAIASAPLFTSGRISSSIDAAAAALEAAQADETTAAMSLKMQVAEAFIAVLRGESALRIAQSHVDSLAAHARDAKSLYEQGMASRTDSLAADIEETNARQELLRSSQRLDDAKAQYNHLLSRNLDAPVILAATFPDLPQGSLQALSEAALRQRPELLSMSRQSDAYLQRAQSIRAENLPQVSVNGGYAYQQNRYQLHEGMWVASVDMQWRLFDATTGHRGDALAGQARALQARRDELAGQIALQVRQAWLAVEETRQRLVATEQAVAQTEENKRSVAEHYREGVATASDVLHAEALRVTSQANFNQAQYDAALAIVRLRWSIGQL